MLAHRQGTLLNAAELARSLAIDGKTVASYLDLMVDLLLVRRLTPLQPNVGKRLTKAPKIYVRDSGLVHTLLQPRCVRPRCFRPILLLEITHRSRQTALN